MTRLKIDVITDLLQRFRRYASILKWDPTQARNPSGSAGGGRWRSVGLQGRGLGTIAPGHREFRAPAADAGRAEQARQREGYVSVPRGMSRTRGNANYDDILNAPTGEGFSNLPRAANFVLPTPPARDDAVVKALQEGTATDSRPLGGGANASVIVTLDDAKGTEAVYKPERGENWTASFTNRDIKRYIQNRDFSLAEREAFASDVDAALGLGIVPATVLRTTVDESHVDVDTSDDDGGGGGSVGYDTYEARQGYDKYKQSFYENPPSSVEDAVSQEMQERYERDQDAHVSHLEDRREEIQGMWDDLKKDYPEETPYGAQSALRAHAALPLGSAPGFARREAKPEEVNPISVFDEAGVDPSSGFTKEERLNIRAVLKARLDEGHRTLGAVDDQKARGHLNRDQWFEDHQESEIQFRDSRIESQVRSYTDWRRSAGYATGSGNIGGGFDRNPDAPHPEGGSFQHFRPNTDGWGTLSHGDGAKLAVLDYVVGSMDRHGSNLLFENGHAVAIDNGYSMPAATATDNFAFRSDGARGWARNTSAMEEGVRAPLHAAILKVDWQALVDRHPNMNAAERTAFLARVENMKIALQTPEGVPDLWKRLRVM